jgi:adenine phosphoribosyltransferase
LFSGVDTLRGTLDWIRAKIRDVPNFPREGITFRDLTPVLADGALFRQVIDLMAAPWRDQKIAKVVGVESRGWIFASTLAASLGVGFALVRKFGTLPRRTLREEYEAGNTVEIHEDAIAAGERVLIVDDLLATGVTAAATGRLVQRMKGEIAGYAFLVELLYLNGAEKLSGSKVSALVRYS